MRFPTKGTREQAFRRAGRFYSAAGLTYCGTFLMLLRLLAPPTAPLDHPVVLCFAGLHVLSLCLLLYTVYLQARALAFDHADVSWRMLLLGEGPFWMRNRMALPLLLAAFALDIGCLLFFL